VGVGREPLFSVLVHNTCEVFNSICVALTRMGVNLDLLLLGVFVRLPMASLGGLWLVSLLCLGFRLWL
jgi:hypothetical protein